MEIIKKIKSKRMGYFNNKDEIYRFNVYKGNNYNEKAK